MYYWQHRYNGRIVKTVTCHYFGFNYPTWERIVEDNIGFQIGLFFNAITLEEWSKNIPFGGQMHDCNSVCYSY